MLHRSGRTGRMGRKGVSITFIEDEKQAELLKKMEQYRMTVEALSIDDMATVEKRIYDDLK